MAWEELAKQVSEYPSTRAAARGLGIPESTLRRRLAQVEDAESTVPDDAFLPEDHHLPDTHVGPDGTDTVDLSLKHKKGVRRYILTSAQNNCKVHQGFLRNLEALANEVDAQILVSFCVYDRAGYRGPVVKGKGNGPQRDIWWDQAIKPYVINSRVKLAKRFAFCGELDVQATAARPLSGLASYCGRSSIAVPHNKFEFECVESRRQHYPKEMHTTGSVTQPKFIQRKTGQLASFHHVLGALLVEVDESGHFWVHHLNADERDGSFYWLDKVVDDGAVLDNQCGIDALIAGDIHFEKCGLAIRDTTFRGKGSVVGRLNPKMLFVHDLIDFTRRNHHNRDDFEHRIEYLEHDSARVSDDIYCAGKFLQEVSGKVPEVYVVNSNHDEAYRRWIHETDWRSDLENAELYLSTALAMVKAAADGTRLNPLQWAFSKYFRIPLGDVTFLDQDDSVVVNDIECGIHGHIGPSGSRGSPASFAKLPFKTFTAHTHSPSIRNGCYTVGVTGNLDMEYNKGPSKWMHTHGIIYPNGKRAFVHIKGGKWHA